MSFELHTRRKPVQGQSEGKWEVEWMQCDFVPVVTLISKWGIKWHTVYTGLLNVEVYFKLMTSISTVLKAFLS